jgi:hypothetical protein
MINYKTCVAADHLQLIILFFLVNQKLIISSCFDLMYLFFFPKDIAYFSNADYDDENK